jgi:hypothetical protein
VSGALPSAVLVRLAFSTLLLGAGCRQAGSEARDLAVSSSAAARASVDAAVVELKAGSEQAVLARFCDDDEDGRRRLLEILRPALGQRDLAITRVEPAWVGSEPWFFVELHAPASGFRHGFGVHVRQGCLTRAVGAARAATSSAPSGVIDL